MNCCKYIINYLFGYYTNINEYNDYEYSQAELISINNKLSINDNYISFKNQFIN
jgi:hypothetical protein